MQASTAGETGGRSILGRTPVSRVPDQILKNGLSGVAAGVLILLAAFFAVLIAQSWSAFTHVGFFNLLFRNNYDVSQIGLGGACSTGHGACTFGMWPMVLGTLLTSGIAVVIGVPIAVATALFIAELCPTRARTPLAILV